MMMAQCIGVSRVTCHRTPGPPITSQRSEGLGLRLLLKGPVQHRREFSDFNS